MFVAICHDLEQFSHLELSCVTNFTLHLHCSLLHSEERKHQLWFQAHIFTVLQVEVSDGQAWGKFCCCVLN